MSESVSVDTDTDTEPSESDLSDKDNAELRSAPSDTLLKGLKNDEDQDTRNCPHNCHGELSVVERDTEEIVLCQSCRCTPDGVYYEPDDSSTPEVGFQAFAPNRDNWDRGLEWRRSGDREKYRNSGNVKMVGGFERPYADERTSPEDSII